MKLCPLTTYVVTYKLAGNTVLDTSATLTFTSTTTGLHGPAVDDVTIQSCLLVLCPHKGTQLRPHSR